MFRITKKINECLSATEYIVLQLIAFNPSIEMYTALSSIHDQIIFISHEMQMVH